jgi:mannose-6-phosphate isomerase-like protein (cupin superfamily)
MLSRIAKIKSVFRAHRKDAGYDLNYSYLAWGPRSKYVTHSHAICEFYYILEGDVEYIINDKEYHGVPGNFYFHPPYYDHKMRGLTSDVPFLSISGSWIPYGKRELFEEPFFLLEEI